MRQVTPRHRWRKPKHHHPNVHGGEKKKKKLAAMLRPCTRTQPSEITDCYTPLTSCSGKLKQLHIHMALSMRNNRIFQSWNFCLTSIFQMLPSGCSQDWLTRSFSLLCIIGRPSALLPTGGSALTFTKTRVRWLIFSTRPLTHTHSLTHSRNTQI